jgi:hypothetical protein
MAYIELRIIQSPETEQRITPVEKMGQELKNKQGKG